MGPKKGATKKISKKKIQPSILCDLFSKYEDIMPVEHEMRFFEERLKTYENWPLGDDCSCNPKALSAAGFYSIRTKESPDATRCFCCYKELDGWEPDDDPRAEHLKHSSNCAFLALGKPVEEITVLDYLDLEKERQKNKMRKYFHAKLQEFEIQAAFVREEMLKLNPL